MGKPHRNATFHYPRLVEFECGRMIYSDLRQRGIDYVDVIGGNTFLRFAHEKTSHYENIWYDEHGLEHSCASVIDSIESSCGKGYVFLRLFVSDPHACNRTVFLKRVLNYRLSYVGDYPDRINRVKPYYCLYCLDDVKIFNNLSQLFDLTYHKNPEGFEELTKESLTGESFDNEETPISNGEGKGVNTY